MNTYIIICDISYGVEEYFTRHTKANDFDTAMKQFIAEDEDWDQEDFHDAIDEVIIIHSTGEITNHRKFTYAETDPNFITNLIKELS